MAGLYDLVGELSGMRGEVRESLKALQGGLDGLAGELTATKVMVTEVRDKVADLVEHLPDPDVRGPIARARDAIVGESTNRGRTEALWVCRGPKCQPDRVAKSSKRTH